MRKKHAAIRRFITDSTEKGSSPDTDFVNSVKEESCNNFNSDVTQTPLFLYDDKGLPVLQDGTPVVEPELVDLQTDKRLNSANKHRHFRRSSQFNFSYLNTSKCTVCGVKIEFFSVFFGVHPALGVILCKRCSKYATDQKFYRDDAGKDESCRWCSDGGDLVCCDKCSNAFCKKCIKQNLGITALKEIESLGDDDTWNCYVCDSTPIHFLQQQCSEIVKKIESVELSRKRELSKSSHDVDRNSCSDVASTITKSEDIAAMPSASENPSVNCNSILVADTATTSKTDVISTVTSTPNHVQASVVSTSTKNALVILDPNLKSPSSIIVNNSPLMVINSPVSLIGAQPQSVATNLVRPYGNLSLTASCPLSTTVWTCPPAPTTPTFVQLPVADSVTRSSMLHDKLVHVNERNVITALRISQTCLENFSKDLRRLENSLYRVHPPPNLTEVVTSFRSIFKFHYQNRLGNLHERIAEQELLNPNGANCFIYNRQMQSAANAGSSLIKHSVPMQQQQQQQPSPTSKISSTPPRLSSFSASTPLRLISPLILPKHSHLPTTVDNSMATTAATTTSSMSITAGNDDSVTIDLTTEDADIAEDVIVPTSTTASSTSCPQFDVDVAPTSTKRKLVETVGDTNSGGSGDAGDVDRKLRRFGDDGISHHSNMSSGTSSSSSCSSSSSSATNVDGHPVYRRLSRISKRKQNLSSIGESPLSVEKNSLEFIEDGDNDDLEKEVKSLESQCMRSLRQVPSRLAKRAYEDSLLKVERGNDETKPNQNKKRNAQPTAPNAKSDSSVDGDSIKEVDGDSVIAMIDSPKTQLDDSSVANLKAREILLNTSSSRSSTPSSSADVESNRAAGEVDGDLKNVTYQGVKLKEASVALKPLSVKLSSRKHTRNKQYSKLMSESKKMLRQSSPSSPSSPSSSLGKRRIITRSSQCNRLPSSSSSDSSSVGEQSSSCLLDDGDDDAADDSENVGVSSKPTTRSSRGKDKQSDRKGNSKVRRKETHQVDTKKSKKVEDDSAGGPRRSMRRRRSKRLIRISSDDDNDDEAADGDTKDGEELDDDEKKDELSQQSGGEVDTEDPADSKGRKKIRKIFTTNKLSESTRTAEALEQERRKRVTDRQKFYNSYVTQTGEGINTVTTKLILDHGDPVIEVHKDIVKHLKVHQVEGIRFLWDCTIESVDRCKKLLSQSPSHQEVDAGHGAILAHCMGLGKTLAIISFVHTLFRYVDVLKVRTCMIICPVNTLLNWKHEWDMWCPADEPVDVFDLASRNSNRFKVDILKHWHSKGGVLLIGYDMFRNLITTLMKRTRSKDVRRTIQSSLVNPGSDIVICDEGHLLKNCKSRLANTIAQVHTKKRIILTGTPLQNNLNEYHAMVNFVKPSLLGTLKEFNNRFVNPIKNGQHSNSTPHDVNIMKKRAHVLYKTLDGCVQRKDYSVLTKYLPPRYEYVVMCRLTPIQNQFYSTFLALKSNRHLNRDSIDIDQNGRGGSDVDNEDVDVDEIDLLDDDDDDDDLDGPLASHVVPKSSLFTIQQILYRISVHPYALRIHETKEARKMLLMEENCLTTEEEEEDLDHVSKSSEQSSKSTSVSILSSSDIEFLDVADKKPSASESVRPTKSKIMTRSRGTNDNSTVIIRDSDDSASSSVEVVNGQNAGLDSGLQQTAGSAAAAVKRKPWWHSLYKDEYDERIDVGAKIDMLFHIIKRCSDIGDKMIIFSHSLISLDLIEKFLAELHNQWTAVHGDENTDQNKAPQDPPLPRTASHFDLSSYFSDIGHNTWIRGLDYERMDGSMNCTLRKNLQNRFNTIRNTRLRLFIISTRAGGLGINLISANRLVLLDASWNPSHDIQSIFRSYRFGQSKPVYIYRLIARGTIEEKIYERQVTKQSLSLRVIDEQQIDRHFSDADLHTLFTFEPDNWDPNAAASRMTPILPKDRLLADLLTDLPHLISTYHNHDSLLQHREDEGLTESERQEAWREFEEERRLGTSLAQHQRMLMIQQEWMNHHQQQQQQQQQQLQQRSASMASQLFRTNAVPRWVGPAAKNQQDGLAVGGGGGIYFANPQVGTKQPIPPLLPVGTNSNVMIHPQTFKFPNARYVAPQPLPKMGTATNSYNLMYEQARNRAVQNDPTLVSNPARLEKVTMDRLLSALTTPVMLNSTTAPTQPSPIPAVRQHPHYHQPIQPAPPPLLAPAPPRQPTTKTLTPILPSNTTK